MKKLIDLHIHSNKSDGKLTGFEIIDEAVKNNVSTLSITDHDDISVYTKELISYSKKNNINIVPGVEISSRYNNLSIHILGYNIDLKNEKFIKTLSEIKNSRLIYLKDVANKLKEFDIELNLDKLSKLDVITKKDIAVDIVTNKSNETVLLNDYGYIPEFGEFIETMMNKGCKAFIEKKSSTPQEVSKLIKEAGGKVVIAHPVVYNVKDKLSFEELKKLIIDMKADGIEANYIYVDVKKEVINQIDKWNDIASELNLFTTIGSDFHDYEEKQLLIGLINYETPDVNIKEILEKL